MNRCDLFHDLLKRDFFPILRAEGFKGSRSTLRRHRGDRVDVVNVQGSSAGGKCCVNLAAHYLFLPPVCGHLPKPMNFKESECIFRDRLSETSEDRWWDYGTTDLETKSNVASLIDLYKRNGTLFFSKFEPFPDVFERVTPAELDTGDFPKLLAGMTDLDAILTMARIMRHIGRHDRCREFAEVGLRHVGRVTWAKEDFEQLRDNA